MKRLYRSRKDRIISGVCGGLGNYLNIDPTIIRIIWAALVLALGTGLLAYIIAMIVIPQESLEEEAGLTGKEDRADGNVVTTPQPFNGSSTSSSTGSGKSIGKLAMLILGIIILLIGVSSLLGHFLGWSFGWLFGWIGRLIWPLIIIGFGVAIIVSNTKK